AAFAGLTSELNLVRDKTGLYIIDCNLNVEKRLVIDLGRTGLTIPIVHLVDLLAPDVCVLRMRPLDPGTDNYCSTVCGMPSTCTDSSIILGLPLLHRYCVSYDPRIQRVGFYDLINEGVPEHDQSVCDYSKFLPYTPMTTSSMRAK
ncbi:hypothetical protein AAVH_35702, partial [Aphelenchoides avenae]